MIHQFLQQNLVHPKRRSPLVYDEATATFRADDGSEFSCVSGVPVIIVPDENQKHHQEHYTIDAVEFDYFEERDAATDHDERRLREMILREVPGQCSHVLDVGCGRAWVAAMLCPRNIHVCSLDISPTNPSKALQTYPFSNHSAVAADAMSLPFADNSFDCVIASEIIEHLPHPELFVPELLRVLKPGGRLLVSTPYKEKLRYVLCIHCNQRTPLHAHLHSFDEKVLSSFAKSNDAAVRWIIFGNKALLILRSYVLLRILPTIAWRFVDRLANLLINKPAHIIMCWTKWT